MIYLEMKWTHADIKFWNEFYGENVEFYVRMITFSVIDQSFGVMSL